MRILDPSTGLLLREHLRMRRGFHRIQERDQPSRTPQSTQALLRCACSAGRPIGMLCDQIHRSDGEPGVRSILGVLAVARKHGPGVVEDAAQAALERRPPVPLPLRKWTRSSASPASTATSSTKRQ